MNPPTEPSADHRGIASLVWQMYVALKGEGFTEAQSLLLTNTWLEGLQRIQAAEAGKQ